ncbi:MAG: PASTA domain-containing protein [Prevotellaceae bacterium]|jgi:beta-lactam-binding protein with PASTA domain|nr:PASTA domain-containing protein [Prevotellaceae bacterium]
MILRDFFTLRKNRFFWFNLIAMLVVVGVIIGVAFHWMDDYTRHGQALSVPNVKGMSLNEADQALREAGLSAVVADSTYVKTEPAGCVLEQNPRGAQHVKRGRMVYLTLNTRNVPMKIVPNVADNSSLRQAEAQLIAAGFRLTEPHLIPGELDWVYGVERDSTELEVGARVPEGTILTLVVGDGGRLMETDSLSIDSLTILGDTVSMDTSWF